MIQFPLLLLIAPAFGSTEPLSNSTLLRLDDAPVTHQWTGSVSASAILTDGNTKTRSASAAADAQYRREHDRTTLGAFWNYQDDRTGVLQRRTGAKAKYDYFFSKKTYGLVQTSIENDAQADLERRWIFGLGIGQQFVENAEHKFLAEAGVSWFDEHFGNSPNNDYVSARAAYAWDWNINKDWVFFHGADIYPSLEDGDDVYAKVDTRIRVTLTEKMFAQGQWVTDWDNTPAAGKKDTDNRYIVSIGWSF